MDFEPSDTVAFVSYLRMLRTLCFFCYYLVHNGSVEALEESDFSGYLFKYYLYISFLGKTS